jgi:hypothetical protein
MGMMEKLQKSDFSLKSSNLFWRLNLRLFDYFYGNLLINA